jgi:hypothetical protein
VEGASAGVRAQIVVQPTSGVVWEHDEGVTHGEPLPLQTVLIVAGLSGDVAMSMSQVHI